MNVFTECLYYQIRKYNININTPILTDKFIYKFSISKSDSNNPININPDANVYTIMLNMK